eukprot:TRINITY_DN108921_c0_g1_i1.p1 TRINITY_DN108921_c0_g1~~TRINITY_DN108921_c0_g1_i1.p1  ORF type:complete len:317 (-),score=55.06 TRINITY_DN108921_c0_g1_i1:254-1204(-)
MLLLWVSVLNAARAAHIASSADDCAVTPANSGALLQSGLGAGQLTLIEDEHTHRKVAWLHIPRAGTSFGLTLAHYVSPSLPQHASFDDWKDRKEVVKKFKKRPEDDRLGLKFAEAWKHKLDFDKMFWKGMKWSAHDKISKQDFKGWNGHFMAMFRAPAAILRSRWYHFGPGEDDAVDKKDYRKFFNRWRGSTTQMLAGVKNGLQHNQQSWTRHGFRKKSVHAARKRLQGFAFVGLTDEWGASICLFHAMFGGEMQDSEVENAHPGGHTEATENPFNTWEDTEDEAVFADVKKIFYANMKKYCGGDACKRDVCKLRN